MSATKPEYDKLPMRKRGVVAKALHVNLLALNAELLAMLERILASHGVRRNFAPIGTIEYAADALNLIAKAKELDH